MKSLLVCGPETLFAVALLLLVMFHSQVGATSQPEILQSFTSVIVKLGQSPVTQTCVIQGDIMFVRVNGTLVDHINIGPLEDRGILFSNQQFYPNGTIEQSVTITATKMNNNTVIQCIAAFTVFSDNATIFIGGPPLSPSLQLSRLNGSTLQVSWDEPFSVEDFPILAYIVRVTSIQDDQIINSTISTRTVLVTLTEAVDIVVISVQAQNAVGYSTPGVISYNYTIGEFLMLWRIDSNVTFFPNEHSVNVLLKINESLPCVELSAEISITIRETANSNDDLLSPEFSVSYSTSDVENTSIVLSRSDGILPGRLYNLTFFAPSTGSSCSGLLYTTGLQSAQIVSDFLTAGITCTFASGRITSKGCHVDFGTELQFNISREAETYVISRSVLLPEGLRNQVSLEMVTVAEILADGGISSISLQPEIVIVPVTTQVVSTTSAASSITECTFFTAIGVLIGIITLLPE